MFNGCHAKMYKDAMMYAVADHVDADVDVESSTSSSMSCAYGRPPGHADAAVADDMPCTNPCLSTSGSRTSPTYDLYTGLHLKMYQDYL